MTPEQIANCLAFLQRADLKGAEVPAFIEVFNALTAMQQAEKESDTCPDSSPN